MRDYTNKFYGVNLFNKYYALVNLHEMYLDDGDKIDFNAGDVMVQRATMHGWANPFPDPYQIAFILIGSQPPSKHWHKDAESGRT